MFPITLLNVVFIACYDEMRINYTAWIINLQVTGELLDDLTAWDVLRSALPVGTVSGAPKVHFPYPLLTFLDPPLSF